MIAEIDKINDNEDGYLPVGALIRKVVLQRGLSYTEFAHLINRSLSAVRSMLDADGINSSLLMSICKVLNYDFFAVYSNLLESKLEKEDDVILT